VPDCDQAAKWLGIGAAKRDRISLANFGMLYDKGCGVPHDEHEALGLFMESANLGVGQAQFNLGVYYRDGKGTEADAVQSYFWFSVAAPRELSPGSGPGRQDAEAAHARSDRRDGPPRGALEARACARVRDPMRS